MDELYSQLGLEPGASREAITRAYRKLVRRYPPELNPGRFARIRRAYELLCSPEALMREACKDPLAALASLFPQPRVTLGPVAPPPEQTLTPAELEALLGPLRKELVRRLLRHPRK